jgi:hypothetical protein
MKMGRGLLLLPLMVSLISCGSKEEADKPPVAGQGKASRSDDPISKTVGTTLGTPMAERVAVLGLLNKRNGQTRDIELKPGEALRIGKVVVRLRACERTAPWENYPDQGAFVQLIVFERPPGTTEAERWRRVFSGWLFKENPAANVVQHRIYDVWIKECRMSFPGEEETAEDKAPDAADGDKPAAKKPSSTPQSPSKAPAPVPGPAADVPEEDTSGEDTVVT